MCNMYVRRFPSISSTNQLFPADLYIRGTNPAYMKNQHIELAHHKTKIT